MTIVRVEKLATGQFDLVLRLTPQESLELAQLLWQQHEHLLPKDDPTTPGDDESEQRTA